MVWTVAIFELKTEWPTPLDVKTALAAMALLSPGTALMRNPQVKIPF